MDSMGPQLYHHCVEFISHCGFSLCVFFSLYLKIKAILHNTCNILSQIFNIKGNCTISVLSTIENVALNCQKMTRSSQYITSMVLVDLYLKHKYGNISEKYKTIYLCLDDYAYWSSVP